MCVRMMLLHAILRQECVTLVHVLIMTLVAVLRTMVMHMEIGLSRMCNYDL